MQQEFLRLLETGDVAGLRAAWFQIAPNMPMPETDEAAEIVMHMTRTGCKRLKLRYRAYSHCWLIERLLPSSLPDELKPKAERMYPRIASAVGISINSKSSWLKPAAKIIERAMCDAVEDVASDGKFSDTELVKRRMKEAREKTEYQLFGKMRPY